MALYIDIIIFAFGALIGSFLNVCIVRMPQEKSIVFPGSHCVKCQKPIAWFDNIPLISWIVLRGKCRHCQSSISARYWFVELLTALIFLGMWRYFGGADILFPYLFMVCCFIVATFVDFEHRIIPDEVSVGGMFAGIFLSGVFPKLHAHRFEDLALGGLISGVLVLACLFFMLIYPIFCKHLMEDYDVKEDRPFKLLVATGLALFSAIYFWGSHLPASWQPHALSVASSLIGFIIGGGVVYLMGLIGDIVFRKESMGGGDVKLMAMVGAFLGWKMAVLAFFIAPFFGAVWGIAEKIRTKESLIAYGPFLVMGSLVSLFFGDQIIHWIMTGMWANVG